MRDVEKQLEALGLNEKEAKVYVASLELGPATAQQIAGKAAVVRPTAYVAIGGLVKRGMMSQFTKGKKQYFSAEKPNRLTQVLQEEKMKLAEKEAQLKAALPMLESLIAASGDKPEVKFYEGLEGLEAMRKVLLESKLNALEVISTLEYEITTPGESAALHDYRLGQLGIGIRQVYFSNNPKLKNHKKKLGKSTIEFRHIKTKAPGDFAEMAIFNDCVSWIAYLDRPYGFLIKNKQVANTARVLFQALWSGLNK